MVCAALQQMDCKANCAAVLAANCRQPHTLQWLFAATKLYNVLRQKSAHSIMQRC